MPSIRRRHTVSNERVQPSDEVPRHLVAIDFVQTFMATEWIEFVSHVLKARRAIRLEKLVNVAADRVTGAAEDVDGQLLGDPGQARGPGQIQKRAKDVDIELYLRFEAAAQRIRDISVDLRGIPRQPVERCPRPLERVVEGPKDQRLHQRAFAPRPDAQALEPRKPEPQPGTLGRCAVRS